MENNQQNQPAPSADRYRPSCMYWLVLVSFALLSLSGWVRLIDSIVNWYWLTFSGVWPGPLYLAVTGGVWGLVGLAALIALVSRYPYSRLIGMTAAMFYAMAYWLDRLLFSRAPFGTGNALFAALVTLLILSLALAILRPLPQLRQFWQRWKVRTAERHPVVGKHKSGA